MPTPIAHDPESARFDQCFCLACLDPEIREFGDRYIIAEWSERQNQWQSSDLPARLCFRGYCYTYGRSLHALVGAGIRTYPTRARARQSLREAARE